jgi:hypothetical protein
MNRQKRFSRKQAITGFVAAVILISALCVSLLTQKPIWLFHWQDFHDGNLVVKHIESFRAERGRLPDSLEELKMKDLSDQIFYQKVDSKNYQVWFSIALGESEVYESDTKQWR